MILFFVAFLIAFLCVSVPVWLETPGARDPADNRVRFVLLQRAAPYMTSPKAIGLMISIAVLAGFLIVLHWLADGYATVADWLRWWALIIAPILAGFILGAMSAIWLENALRDPAGALLPGAGIGLAVAGAVVVLLSYQKGWIPQKLSALSVEVEFNPTARRELPVKQLTSEDLDSNPQPGWPEVNAALGYLEIVLTSDRELTMSLLAGGTGPGLLPGESAQERYLRTALELSVTKLKSIFSVRSLRTASAPNFVLIASELQRQWQISSARENVDEMAIYRLLARIEKAKVDAKHHGETSCLTEHRECDASTWIRLCQSQNPSEVLDLWLTGYKCPGSLTGYTWAMVTSLFLYLSNEIDASVQLLSAWTI